MARSLVIASILIFLIGCTVGSGDGIGAGVGVGVGQEQSALWTIGAASGSPPTWDSGSTQNLSTWQSVTCNLTSGPSFIVTGLTGFDDKGNIDNYMARVEVTCGEYHNVGDTMLPDGVEHTFPLCSSSYQQDPTHVDVSDYASPGYAAGVLVYTNPGDGYVQSLVLEYVEPLSGHLLGNYGTPGQTDPIDFLAFSLGGNGEVHELICPDQYVMSGMAVRTSTGSGKIRTLKIYCRPLTWSE